MNIQEYITSMGKAARAAAQLMAKADSGQKSKALENIATNLRKQRAQIQKANALDLQNAKKNGNLSAPLLERLKLDDSSMERMIEGLGQVAALPDPIGEIVEIRQQPSGIEVGRMRVPLGVIAIIYESRPNVTLDAAALCLKSGNAVILRGGSEAIESNRQLAACIVSGVEAANLPATAVQFVANTDREAVSVMLKMPEYIDVIIPRGGKGLIERLDKESKIPLIKHLDGICHVYIDSDVDLDKAIAIAVNSKTEKYASCNALETLLVATAIATDILPKLAAQLEAKNVKLKGCTQTRAILSGLGFELEEASQDDWGTEYLDAVLAIRVVADLDAAISHINTWGSKHTDCIVSENYSNVRRFLREVDSASVLVNASTQFADGFEFGLGAEIGISTNRLHVRGPVGLEGLTIQKFVVFGNGEIRQR